MTLHLTLIKKWFDKIASGEKKEEYRQVKPYWTNRLFKREYKEILFKNGYGKESPTLRIELLGIGRTVNEFGDVYVLKLGRILPA